MEAELPIPFTIPFSILRTFADAPLTIMASDNNINAIVENRRTVVIVPLVEFISHHAVMGGWLNNFVTSTYVIAPLPLKSNA